MEATTEQWELYIIQENATKNIKVGYGKNVQSRLSGIQLGNPRKLSIVFSESFKSEKEARTAEKALHDHLMNSSLSGEWFEYRESYPVLIHHLRKDGVVQYLSNHPSFSFSSLKENYKDIIKQASIATINGFSENDYEQLRMFADKLQELGMGIRGRIIAVRQDRYHGEPAKRVAR